MTSDEQFMREAIKEAEIAGETGNWPMGCVIVIDDKVVARSHNTGYTDKNRMAHAELKALYGAKDILEKNKGRATVYTTYEPCPMCFGALVIMKVGRVVTGVDLDQSGCLDMLACLPPFFNQDKFKFEITRGILSKECLDVYQRGSIGAAHLEKVTK